MALLNVNTNPTDRQLRQFGGICVVAFPLIAWLWTRDTAIVGWAGAAGLACGGIAVVLPSLLKPLFLGLTIATFPIGLVVGELAMLFIFFGVFLPMAIAFRMIGRDALTRRSTEDAETYWVERESTPGAGRYFRQT